MSEAVKLHVCLFDRNCEEVATEEVLTLTNPEKMSLWDIYYAFHQLAVSSSQLRLASEELGAYDFSAWQWDDVSVQVDTRESLIRIRDMGDTIGEPGNIGMMVNLRLVRD